MIARHTKYSLPQIDMFLFINVYIDNLQTHLGLSSKPILGLLLFQHFSQCVAKVLHQMSGAYYGDLMHGTMMV